MYVGISCVASIGRVLLHVAQCMASLSIPLPFAVC